MNGVKFFGSRPTDMVLAYAAAVVMAEGSGLAPLFKQVLDCRTGRYNAAANLRQAEYGGIGGGCDEEALRVVQSMPNWKPGKQRGKPVRVKYTVPVNFRLQ